MGMTPFKEVLFEGRVPEITRIVDKVVELSGLAVRIRQTVDRNTAERYDLDAYLAFECAPDDAIWLGAGPGAENFFWGAADEEQYPPGKQAVYLSFGGLEPTLRTYVRLALGALGGELKHPLDEASRRLCAGPITELELERRKWKVSGKLLLTMSISGFAEAFYVICEAFGIKFPHRRLNEARRQAQEQEGVPGRPALTRKILLALVQIARFPFKLFFTILGAIFIAVTALLVIPYFSLTFAGKTARLAFHLLTRRESAQGITPEQAEEEHLTAAEKSARNILQSMKQTYGAAKKLIPASEAEFSHLDLSNYRRFRADMEAERFKYVGDFEILRTSQSAIALFSETMIRIMVSQDGSITTTYYQHKRRRWPLIKALATGLLGLNWVSTPKYFVRDLKTRHCVGFGSEFDDGRYLITSNAEAAGKITMPPNMEQHFFPYDTATPVLLDAHRKRMAEILQTNPGIGPLVASGAEDILQAHDRLSAQKGAYRASVQWVTQDELRAMSNGNHRYADEVYAEVQKLIAQDAAKAAPSTPLPDRAN